MDNEATKVHQQKKKSRLSKTVLVTLLIAVVLFAIGGIYYYQAKRVTLNTSNIQPSKPGGGSTTEQALAALTSRQRQQIANGTSTATKEKRFDVAVGNFYFTPNKIIVNQGDKVTIVLNDAFGLQDLVVDEFHIKTPIIQAGKSASVTFIADKKGTFEFYNSIPGHRHLGMVGRLVVQ